MNKAICPGKLTLYIATAVFRTNYFPLPSNTAIQTNPIFTTVKKTPGKGYP